VGREVLITIFRWFAKRRGIVIPAMGAGKLKAVVQNSSSARRSPGSPGKDAIAQMHLAGDFRNFWDQFHGWFVAVTLAGAIVLTVYSLLVYLYRYRGHSSKSQVKLEGRHDRPRAAAGPNTRHERRRAGPRLAAAGVEVVRRSSVADRRRGHPAAGCRRLERTGFVITTGGLGPTRDDMTKREVARPVREKRCNWTRPCCARSRSDSAVSDVRCRP